MENIQIMNKKAKILIFKKVIPITKITNELFQAHIDTYIFLKN